jgi:hypothetical protein
MRKVELGLGFEIPIFLDFRLKNASMNLREMGLPEAEIRGPKSAEAKGSGTGSFAPNFRYQAYSTPFFV